MKLRRPLVAGQFYPAKKQLCQKELEGYTDISSLDVNLPSKITAGIVPHAGWTFSGGTAGKVFSAIKRQNKNVDTFVVFGAAHGYFGKLPAIYPGGKWQSPLGDIKIDSQLSEKIVTEELAVEDERAHGGEHSIEVQVPMIQYLFPDAELVAIIAPPAESTVRLGEGIAELVKASDKDIVCIGSTDLTHYGPRYGFTPMGAGYEGIKWASEVNDRKFIELAEKMDGEGILQSAAENANACGPGAGCATVTAAANLSAQKGVLLEHTNSNEMMTKLMGTNTADSVGYAGIVF
jgi:hypothetical protein